MGKYLFYFTILSLVLFSCNSVETEKESVVEVESEIKKKFSNLSFTTNVKEYVKIGGEIKDQRLWVTQLDPLNFQVKIIGDNNDLTCSFDQKGIRSNNKIFVDLSNVVEGFSTHLVIEIKGDSALVYHNDESNPHEIGIFCSGLASLKGTYLHEVNEAK